MNIEVEMREECTKVDLPVIMTEASFFAQILYATLLAKNRNDEEKEEEAMVIAGTCASQSWKAPKAERRTDAKNRRRRRKREIPSF